MRSWATCTKFLSSCMCFWKRLLSSSSSRSKSLAASSKAWMRPFHERSAGTWGATAELTPVPITSTSSGARLVFRLGSSFLWSRQRLSDDAFQTLPMVQRLPKHCVSRAAFFIFFPAEERTRTLETVCVIHSAQFEAKEAETQRLTPNRANIKTEASEGNSSKLKSALYTTNLIPHLQITALVAHNTIYMCNTFTFISVPAGLKIPTKCSHDFEASSQFLIRMQVSRMWRYSRAYLQTRLNIKGNLSGGMSQESKGGKKV